MIFVIYHPPSRVDEYFLGEVRKIPDKYCQICSNILLTNDFNVEESGPLLAPFLHDYSAVNIIHENTSYKSMNSSIVN